jgi:gliding motility-associated-like protein
VRKIGADIKKLILLFGLIFFSIQVLFSIHISKDNYTGNWGTPTSWDPVWTAPLNTINNFDVIIFGYITLNGNLTFTGSSCTLTVNDTLVVNGDLSVGNNNDLIINPGGVLIIRGNLSITNKCDIIAMGYLIVTGNFTIGGSNSTFTSNQYPSLVFIGGTFPPAYQTNPSLPVLNCPADSEDGFEYSGCNYGNNSDLEDDPIYQFFVGTCTVPPTIELDNTPEACYGASIVPINYYGTTGNPDRYSIDFNAAAESAGFIDVSGTAALPASPITLAIPTDAAAGVYEGILKVNSSKAGCISAGYPVSIKISTVPGAAGKITGASSVCQGTRDVVYSVPVIQDATGYSWSLPTGANIISGSNTNSITVSYSATAKSGKITVSGKNHCGNGAVSADYNITVNPIPLVVITNPDAVCSPSTVDLTDTEVTAGSMAGLTYTYWTDSKATVEYATPENASGGTWYIKGTSSKGCYDIKPVIATINITPSLIISEPDAVCEPETVDLTAMSVTAGSTSGLIYSYWSDASASTAYITPETATSGTYYIKGTASTGCYEIKPVKVTVNTLPEVSITSSNDPLCINDQRLLTGIPAGGTFIINDGPGKISEGVLSATGAGDISITYIYSDACTNKVSQTIAVNEMPDVNPGPDQVLEFVFTTNMAAELSPGETGEWTINSGSGRISDIHSPVTDLSELALGKNIFTWKVISGACKASADLIISVEDLFIPTVITPNGDGKNDFFMINVLTEPGAGQVELIILNKWGSVEYRNENYANDWDGKNDRGADLENDTYMYILKFENGIIKKGTVLITR